MATRLPPASALKYKMSSIARSLSIFYASAARKRPKRLEVLAPMSAMSIAKPTLMSAALIFVHSVLQHARRRTHFTFRHIGIDQLLSVPVSRMNTTWESTSREITQPTWPFVEQTTPTRCLLTYASSLKVFAPHTVVALISSSPCLCMGR